MLESAKIIGVEKLNFQNAVGKVLATDIHSDINMPPFNKAAMDGYACRAVDLGNALEVIEIIPAGVAPQKTIGENQCAKIMTGAPVPEGADTVIMVEYTQEVSPNQIRYTKESSKSNICYLAEDVNIGDVVLTKGTLILPKHIPVLAAVGVTQIEVFKTPRLAVVSTGDELVEPDVVPDASQIRNSNAYQMVAQAQQMGLEMDYIGVANDTKESTRIMMEKAMQNADVILMSGAVSMGDFDFVPIVLQEVGIDIHFHGVETKPGKKTVFGTSNNKYFIGVPGNPVSAFVQFEMLIKPMLYRIMGANWQNPLYKMPLEGSFKRKQTSRKSFEPVVFTADGKAKLIDYHGSAHINALSYAQGLMIVEAGVAELQNGDIVDVRPI
jgi:molybdopterin molybdotransferase